MPDIYDERVRDEYEVYKSVNNHVRQGMHCVGAAQNTHLWRVDGGLPNTLFDNLGNRLDYQSPFVYKQRRKIRKGDDGPCEMEVTPSTRFGRFFIDYLPGRSLQEAIDRKYPDGNIPFDELAVFTEDKSGEPLILRWNQSQGEDPTNEPVVDSYHSRKNHTDIRHVFALDDEQAKIQFSNLFNGRILVIDGGPGTGKSTTMLQRLKLFFDPEFYDRDNLENNKDIDRSQIQHILDNAEKIQNELNSETDNRWVYFTPTLQLKNFLKNDLIHAGLTYADKHTQTWDVFCQNAALESYGIPVTMGATTDTSIGHFTDSPLDCRKNFLKILFDAILVDFNTSLRKFGDEYFRAKDLLSGDLDVIPRRVFSRKDMIDLLKKIERLGDGVNLFAVNATSRKAKAFAEKTAAAIQRTLATSRNVELEWLYFIQMMEDAFDRNLVLSSKDIVKGNSRVAAFKSILGQINYLVTQMEGLWETTVRFESNLFQNKISAVDLPRRSREEDFDYVVKDVEQILDFCNEILRQASSGNPPSLELQAVCRKIVGARITSAFSDADVRLFRKYAETLVLDILKKRGHGEFRSELFGDGYILNGREVNLDVEMDKLLRQLDPLKSVYAELNPSIWLNKLFGDSFKSSFELIRKKYGFETFGTNGEMLLSPQEKSFWIFLNNSLAKAVLRVWPGAERYTTVNGLKGYLKERKVVICIDEVTDYSLMDLAAIFSLADLRFASINACGDTMQTFNPEGIREWDDLKLCVRDCDVDVRELRVSYRQTETLLNMAKSIYKRVKGRDPGYEPILQKEGEEPLPLLFRGSDDGGKISWIIESILKIRENNDNVIPAVAIFYPSEDKAELGQFRDQLIAASSGLFDIASYNEMSDAKVVVYPISHVKGLEFESAFFYDIDKMGNGEMQNCYLYVGLSRATRYLAATASYGWDEEASAGLSADFTDSSLSNW